MYKYQNCNLSKQSKLQESYFIAIWIKFKDLQNIMFMDVCVTACMHALVCARMCMCMGMMTIVFMIAVIQ